MSEKKTSLERMEIVNEVENRINSERLENEIASKVLMRILNDYLIHGTVYLDKRLTLKLRDGIERQYVINLYNDRSEKDTVHITIKK